MSSTFKKGHKVETIFNQATGMPTHISWTDENGKPDAPGDLPSEMRFTEKGSLLCAFWKRGGKLNRDGDLPTRIYYDKVSGKPYAFFWDKDNVEHREGDRPSYIAINPETGALKELQFCKNGQPFRSGGRIPYFSFDDNDTTRDSEDSIVEFDGFDDRWLPEHTTPKLF